MNDETGEVETVGGILYTIKDGIVYDAKQLLADVAEMVEEQKRTTTTTTDNQDDQTTAIIDGTATWPCAPKWISQARAIRSRKLGSRRHLSFSSNGFRHRNRPTSARRVRDQGGGCGWLSRVLSGQQVCLLEAHGFLPTWVTS